MYHAGCREGFGIRYESVPPTWRDSPIKGDALGSVTFIVSTSQFRCKELSPGALMEDTWVEDLVKDGVGDQAAFRCDLSRGITQLRDQWRTRVATTLFPPRSPV